MTESHDTPGALTLVAIDIAKGRHDCLGHRASRSQFCQEIQHKQQCMAMAGGLEALSQFLCGSAEAETG
jgi:hypothetical protein